MPTQVLVRDEKYRGQYVALKSFDDNTVVGSGKTPLSALKKARASGVQDPVIVFVPPKGMARVF
jgi:hypothetical protein